MSFEELMQDIQFVSSLYFAQDMDAVKSLFSEAGLEITEEELMAHILPNGKEELKEPELESVAGGAKRLNPFISWLNSCGYYSSSGGAHHGGGGHHG